MDEEKLIKQKIKATRERKGYTRKEMAERLNLSVLTAIESNPLCLVVLVCSG